MNKRSISLIVGLMGIALLGVMAMQYYFIRQSFHLKAQLFDESVMAALNTVALKAEKDEALRFLNEREMHESKIKRQRERQARESSEHKKSLEYANRMRMKRQQLNSEFKALEQQVKRRYPGAVLLDNSFYETYIKDPAFRNHVNYEVTIQTGYDEKGNAYQQQEWGIYSNQKAKVIKRAKDDSVRYFVVDPVVGEFVISLPPRVDVKLEEEIRQLEQQAKFKMASVYIDSMKTKGSALENLANEFERAKKSISQRIDPTFMREELKEELANRKINLAFDFKISNSKTDSVIFQFAKHNFIPEMEEVYTTTLFPSDMAGERATLSIFFPAKSSLLMGNMKLMLVLSVALLVVLVGSFAFTILSIL